jgi:hypothetical protein
MNIADKWFSRIDAIRAGPAVNAISNLMFISFFGHIAERAFVAELSVWQS